MKPLVHTVGRERIETRELAPGKFATVRTTGDGQYTATKTTSELDARAAHDKAVKESAERQNAEK